jgi:hypothetical protein
LNGTDLSHIEFKFNYKKLEYKITVILYNSSYEFPAVVSNGFNVQLYNNEYIITGMGTCLDENIIIPSQIDGFPVVEIAKDAFKNEQQIKSVIIPGSIKTIGVSAFENCLNLQSVQIQNGTTTICSKAFAYIDAGAHIQFSDSIIEIGKDAFINDFNPNTQGIWNFMGDINNYVQIKFGNEYSAPNFNKTMYLNGSKLTEVFIDEAETISAYAFYNNQNIKIFKIGKQVQSIGMNALCGVFKTLLANGTSYYTPYNIHYEGSVNDFFKIEFAADWACGSSYILHCDTVLIEKVIIDNIEHIPAYIFNNCASIKTLSLSGAVTSIGEFAFYGCPLENVILSESVVVFGENCFNPSQHYQVETTAFVEYDGCLYLSANNNPYYLLIKKLNSSANVHENCKFSIE